MPLNTLPLDTFIVFAASYDTLAAAEADYRAVHDSYLTSGLLGTYDATVITKDDAGEVRIVIQHEQPAHRDAWRRLGIGLVGGALDKGHSGLVVVAASDLDDLVEHVTKRASRLNFQEAVAESQAAVREAESEAQAAERAAERYSTFGSRPAARDDLASQLDDLARLREKGALSQAEFDAAKSRLLGLSDGADPSGAASPGADDAQQAPRAECSGRTGQ
jgi:putative oligomerization/nucleic acid binding protein